MLMISDISNTPLISSLFSNYLSLVIPEPHMLNLKHSDQIYCMCCICVWSSVFRDIVCVLAFSMHIAETEASIFKGSKTLMFISTLDWLTSVTHCYRRC